MTSSEGRDCRAYRDLLPLYVKGLLPPDQAAEVKQALETCPELRSELEEWNAIGQAYRELEDCLPEPSADAFGRLMQRIEKPHRPGFMEWLGLRPVFSFAMVAAQVVIIVAFGIYAANLKSHFETLSAPSAGASDQVRLNVVFRPEAPESAIREALKKIDGKIMDGPRNSGLYVVGINRSSDPEAALAALRASGSVVMAEKAYQ